VILELVVTAPAGQKARFTAPIESSVGKIILYIATPDGRVLRTLELDVRTLTAKGDWL
jgi:hypothetical protein